MKHDLSNIDNLPCSFAIVWYYAISFSRKTMNSETHLRLTSMGNMQMHMKQYNIIKCMTLDTVHCKTNLQRSMHIWHIFCTCGERECKNTLSLSSTHLCQSTRVIFCLRGSQLTEPDACPPLELLIFACRMHSLYTVRTVPFANVFAWGPLKSVLCLMHVL
jgi:hypothetical protein